MLNLGSEFSEEAQNSCLINVMLSCKVTIAVTANSNNNINNNNKMLCVGKKACLVTDVPIWVCQEMSEKPVVAVPSPLYANRELKCQTALSFPGLTRIKQNDIAIKNTGWYQGAWIWFQLC